MLLDVDCTLKRYGAEHFEPGVLEWLDGIRQGGIILCLLSNGRGKRIGRVAEQLQLPFVARACKPLPLGCRKAMRMIGASPGRTAMVGDQLFADIIAGRLAGLTSILVRPIRPEEEHWFTRMKRPAEQLLLGWMKRDS